RPEIVVNVVVKGLWRLKNLIGCWAEVRNLIVSLAEWRLIVVSQTCIHGKASEGLPLVLKVEARCPGSKVSRRVSGETQRVRGQPKQQIRQRIIRINSAGKLKLTTAVQVEGRMERQVSDSRAELCLGGSMLPGKVVRKLETPIQALLRQIGRITKVRIIRHQNGRHSGVLVAKNRSGLLQI